MMMDALRYICLLAILLLQMISLGCAEFCGGDVHCYAPYTCCESRQSCCYDRDRDYSISVYKLQLWNMWYFWFIIIFVLFFCFGGCGYYRRRRLAAMAQMSQGRQALGLRTAPGANTFAYTSPAYTAEPSTDFQPPPYTEVISQPDLYPSNKAELPPYPGTPVPPHHLHHTEAGTTGGTAEDRMSVMPQPPPYSELDLAASTSIAASSSIPAPQPPQGTAVNHDQPAAPPSQPANQ